jgi:L-fuculose-phosphate aldolase
VKNSAKTANPGGRRRAAEDTRGPAANPRLFTTPEAKTVKKEICAVGRKLWLRQFVDGNGGNISYRIGPNEVICTPTMVSKFDLTPADLCMVDLDGNQIAGTKPRTSEISLHLEIFKAVPEARAAVHCHPPHATAYAVTGLVPPNLVIPEFEIFVGKVATAPYETPGTDAFARTVLPFVKQHNTVLLTNHGVVCWADSVTVAEWNCEVLDTYCTILMLASQLGAPVLHIPELKAADLLARKKRMGLPDVRFSSGIGEQGRTASVRASERPASRKARPRNGQRLTPDQVEALVRRVTREVMEEMNAR